MSFSPSPVSILVVVPAHNEEDSIGQTIESVQNASLRTFGDLNHICMIVVCDSCTDRTQSVAEAQLSGTTSLVTSVSFRNVGMSRDHGVKVGLAMHNRAFWIAFTDADTRVDADWLTRQVHSHAQGHDGYFGRVKFDRAGDLLMDFGLRYDTQTHKRIHGANMGLSTTAYLCVGGIPRLTAHEDKVLAESLEEQGFDLKWDEIATVHTSARTVGRAPEGFAATLKRFAQSYVLAM